MQDGFEFVRFIPNAEDLDVISDTLATGGRSGISSDGFAVAETPAAFLDPDNSDQIILADGGVDSNGNEVPPSIHFGNLDRQAPLRIALEEAFPDDPEARNTLQRQFDQARNEVLNPFDEGGDVGDVTQFFDGVDLVEIGDGNDGTEEADDVAEIGLNQDGNNFVNDGFTEARGEDAVAVSLDADGNRVLNEESNEISADGVAVSISGTNAVIDNQGLIDGGVTGVDFTNGGESSGDLLNSGTITSDGRGVNIGGDDVAIDNSGEIIGTGEQRNGTIYSDGTANNFSINNTGLIDAGEGNNGAGVSLQLGDVDGDVIEAALTNSGSIIGRGAAGEGPTIGDGLRLSSDVGNVTFNNDIVNNGEIIGSQASDEAAGISIESGISVAGNIVNNGSISGPTAIDASEAGNGISISNSGEIDGDVILSDNDDIFTSQNGSAANGDIIGGAGQDEIIFVGQSIDDFTISDGEDGETILVDNNSQTTTTLSEIEQVSFEDEVLALDQDNQDFAIA